MVWGAMGAIGVGNLVLIERIMKKISKLKYKLAPSAAKLNLNGGYYFVQDTDSKHSVLVVKEWLL